MVVIRLSRGGAKKRPFYHVVVADKRARRDDRNIERIGYFKQIACGPELQLKLNMYRIEHWFATGAKASDRVNGLIKAYKKAGGDIASNKESVATRAANYQGAPKKATSEKKAKPAPKAKKAETAAEKTESTEE